MTWIFNLIGVGEVIVAAAADFAFGKRAGFAALVLVDLAYRLLRNRTQPTAKALFLPGNGGQFFFVPCWMWGILLLIPNRFLPGFMQPDPKPVPPVSSM